MGKIEIKFIFCGLKQEFLYKLKSHLEETFLLEVEISSLSIDVSRAYDVRRNQYLGEVIINQAKNFKKDINEKWLLIVDVDLYAKGLNFIFGEADPITGISIISLVRLKPEFYKQKPNEKLFLERILKEATHELGHLFYLPHCENSNCVMYFSNSILDTDKKDKYFCEYCKSLLKANIILKDLK